jgi:nitrous oxidase accessory protein NosD
MRDRIPCETDKMTTDSSLHRHFPCSLISARALFLLLLLLASPLAALHAQGPAKIFVASFGSDASDGSRGNPKRTFQLAHDAVAAGGQIVVLDTAGYGPVTITKSLAVTVPPGVNGFITVLGTNDGITINAAATDSVSLRGLIIEGGGAGGSGILINSAANVAVEDCTVRNFGNGIDVEGPTKLYVRRCTLRACDFAGLFMQLGDTGSVSAVASNCQFDQNRTNGVAVEDFSDFGAGNGHLDLILRKCTFSGNATGIDAFNGGARIRVDNCRITGNAKGIFFSGNVPGQIFTRGNNTLENNSAGNTAASFTGPYSAK